MGAVRSGPEVRAVAVLVVPINELEVLAKNVPLAETRPPSTP
jgi:hypothetical protein